MMPRAFGGVGLAGMFAVVLALATPPEAVGYQLNAKGKRGTSTVYEGTCAYRVFGPRGILRVVAETPSVTGANTRRGTRREKTWVRHKVEVVDVGSGHATLTSSGWSDWIRVAQNRSRTWPGRTEFDMDWRGAYDTDILIEWHNARRRVGWRWERVSRFNYYDQYNTGPYGPFSYCYKP
jgi:hypothetical protein